jgi:hypothetical protein
VIEEPAAPARSPRPSAAVAAVATFASVLVVLLAMLIGSALLFAGPEALWNAAGPVRLARFCALLALVTAYVAAALVIVVRGAREDFAALRAATAATPAQWGGHERRFRSARGAAAAALVGALAGVAIDRVGARVGDPFGDASWRGLLAWVLVLNVLLFAALAMLMRWSVLEIRSLRAIGRSVRVSLLDKSALAPFVRAGLRTSIAWLVGSSIATTLMLDVNVPWIVAAVVAITMALGIATLLLPSATVNARLEAEKRRELAWVRGEIERARRALEQDQAPADLARLPALLAWETRIERATTWPFDTPTLLRFSLLLLIPLGSWVGGALVERALGAVIGD